MLARNHHQGRQVTTPTSPAQQLARMSDKRLLQAVEHELTKTHVANPLAPYTHELARRLHNAPKRKAAPKLGPRQKQRILTQLGEAQDAINRAGRYIKGL